MLQKLNILFAGILLITACNNSTSESTKKVEKKKSELHLNEGKKWIANKEAHEGMSNLKKLLSEMSDSINFDDLVIKMKEETQFIIQNCNMQGEDHNQLHIVLVTIIKGINNINNASGIEANKKGIDKIQKNLEDYFDHFTTN